MTTIGELVAAWRLSTGLKTGELAKLAGTTRQSIENLESGSVSVPRYWRGLARAMGYEQSEDLLDLKPPPMGSSLHSTGSSATQPSIDDSSFEEVVCLKWEDLLMECPKKDRLPPLFQLQLPDDAMAPRARAGARVTFRRDEAPRAGDGVLARDASGALYFRYYRPRRADHWEAHAENREVLPLDSVADGLEVLGVLVGLEARWG